MEPFIGEIRLFAGTFAPRGWAFCDGKEIQIKENQALYSVLFNNYGGDLKTVFNLPNKEHLPPLPPNSKAVYIICMEGVYPSRN
jgi:microcystin-dependent protein